LLLFGFGLNDVPVLNEHDDAKKKVYALLIVVAASENV